VVTDSALVDREATIDTIDFFEHRSSKLCFYCKTPINWMYTRFGGRLPFNMELLPRELDHADNGWLPGLARVGGRERMTMAPITFYGRDKVARVTHVAIVHRCAQYLAKAKGADE
jgi:hypothetical protein